MDYKEWSKHDDEIMNDVLFRIRDNGGVILEDAVSDMMHQYFGNKYEALYRKDSRAFTKKLDDLYGKMIDRGWICRKGGSLHLTDKGCRVEQKGSSVQIVTERQIEHTEELLLEMSKPNLFDKIKPYIPLIVGVLVVIVLLWLLLSGTKSREWILEKALDIIT